METKSEDVLDDRIRKNIEFNARRLARINAIEGMDVSDYRQDLALDLIRRQDRFDSTRASFATFADRIIVHRSATLAKPTLRQLEERNAVSLEEPFVDADGQPSTWGDVLADPSGLFDDAVSMRVDTERFLSGLSSPLLQCCAIHLGDSVAKEAEAAGINRSTFYERTRRLREHATDAGLCVYFPGRSDTPQSQPVSGAEGDIIAVADSHTMLHKTPRLRAQLLVTSEELRAWIADAVAGAQLEYFRGFLAIDRMPTGSRLPAEYAQELDRAAKAALALSEAGRVHLVQRRLGPDEYSYICIARPGREMHRGGGRS